MHPDPVALQRTGLVRRNSLIIFVVMILTWGIYAVFWIRRVARDINSDMDESVISEKLLAVATVLSITFPVTWLAIANEHESAEIFVPFCFLSIWYYPYMIVRARQALEYRTDTMPGSRGAFSPALTYLLGVSYLQWRLNWHLRRGVLRDLNPDNAEVFSPLPGQQESDSPQ